MPKLIERLAIAAVSVAIAIGIVALLSGGLLAGRDTPGVAGTDTGPGTAFRDQGDARLARGGPRPAYDSEPPTSGPHVPTGIPADGTRLSDNQILTALSVGDVVFLYGTRRPPSGLRATARALAPRFTPALAASGQAVILGRRPGTDGIVALAWAHMLRAPSATDAALRSFAQYWLGRRTVRPAAVSSAAAPH